MSQDPAVQRLVTFLGMPPKGEYEKTTYLSPMDPGQSTETRFVADALVHFLKPKEVIILATDEAWRGQGEELMSQIRRHGVQSVRRETLPPGQNEGELWSQFEILKNSLRLPDRSMSCSIALDITHGYRSVPFFSAGVVTFLQLVDDTPPEISVYYGAFEARQENRTPIWNLTAFSDLISWASKIMLFLKTGRANGLADATEDIGRSLRKEWALGGRQGEAPSLAQLGRALAKFGGDLETVRTGSLMLPGSSVKSLHDELGRVKSDNTAQAIPPLADVLDRIAEKTKSLLTDARLSEPDGIKALQSLAQLYYEMGRYAESASTVREAAINKFACSQSDCPGQPSFSKEHRMAAEDAWFKADENRAKEIGQVRNDIEHAGYNSQPMSPEAIKGKIKTLISQLYEVETQHDA